MRPGPKPGYYLLAGFLSFRHHLFLRVAHLCKENAAQKKGTDSGLAEWFTVWAVARRPSGGSDWQAVLPSVGHQPVPVCGCWRVCLGRSLQPMRWAYIAPQGRFPWSWHGSWHGSWFKVGGFFHHVGNPIHRPRIVGNASRDRVIACFQGKYTRMPMIKSPWMTWRIECKKS